MAFRTDTATIAPDGIELEEEFANLAAAGPTFRFERGNMLFPNGAAGAFNDRTPGSATVDEFRTAWLLNPGAGITFSYLSRQLPFPAGATLPTAGVKAATYEISQLVRFTGALAGVERFSWGLDNCNQSRPWDTGFAPSFPGCFGVFIRPAVFGGRFAAVRRAVGGVAAFDSDVDTGIVPGVATRHFLIRLTQGGTLQQLDLEVDGTRVLSSSIVAEYPRRVAGGAYDAASVGCIKFDTGANVLISRARYSVRPFS